MLSAAIFFFCALRVKSVLYHTVCENWGKKISDIIICHFSNLRIDSLAQMLTHGNIRAGMTVAVVDTCMGLVTGAVLERLGGNLRCSS